MIKKILITGTSRGLGRSLANEFIKRRYDVIASARNVEDIKNPEVYKRIPLDVTNEEQVKKAVNECGDIDILINNAAYTVGGPPEAIPIGEIKKEYETNVIGPLRLIKAFLPGMRKNGKNLRCFRILNGRGIMKGRSTKAKKTRSAGWNRSLSN